MHRLLSPIALSFVLACGLTAVEGQSSGGEAVNETGCECEVEAPESACPGETIAATVTVTSRRSEPHDILLPVTVTGIAGATVTPSVITECPSEVELTITAPSAGTLILTACESQTIMVVDVAFTSLEDGHRIGVSANGNDRSQTHQATVTPAEAADFVTIQASDDKVAVSDVTNSGGTITFSVSGKTASEAEGDTGLEAVLPSGCIEDVSMSVIVPHHIGEPHPTFEGEVEPVNTVGDATTSPTWWGPLGEGKVLLWTLWTTVLDVPVRGQFDQPIGDLYGGATITEAGQDTNLTLSNDSTYPDPVGFAVPKQTEPVIVDADSPEVDAWREAGPAVEIPESGVERDSARDVEVDGFPLEGGTGSRPVTLTRPNHLEIEWP